MALHHRHKQRILTTIVTLIVFCIAVDTFIILQPTFGSDLALLFAFIVAIGLITAYQCYNYRHSHEHLTLVNTLTQIFMGTILFVSAIIILILHLSFGWDITTSYLLMCGLVVALTFLFLKQFDEFLEKEVRTIVPMGTPPLPKKMFKKPSR